MSKDSTLTEPAPRAREPKRPAPSLPDSSDALDNARESITYFRTMEDREEDHAPLSLALIRRISSYTHPYRARRTWMLFLTLSRGIQLPILAWMIGQTINGPIAGHNLRGIFVHAALYFALVLIMLTTLHFRQRFALELGEAVAH